MIAAALGLSPEQTHGVLEAATRAPSVHNSQPWRFRTTVDTIELLADPARRLPAADPDDRELRLACGAALFNLRLALLSLGVQPDVSIHPSADPDSIATIRHGGAAMMLPEQAAMFRAIRHRRTNRKPFLEQAVGAGEQHLLIKAAEAERCRFEVVSDAEQRADLQRMLTLAHHHQRSDPRWIAEFDSWLMRSPADHEGIPLVASGPRPEIQDAWVLRDFALGRGNVRVTGKDFESEPLIAVLASYVDDPLAQVQAGQALQQVLLTVTTLGLAASFLSQIIEVADARAALRRTLGDAVHPQAVLRIGYGSPVPEVGRRPVEDCMVAETSMSNG